MYLQNTHCIPIPSSTSLRHNCIQAQEFCLDAVNGNISIYSFLLIMRVGSATVPVGEVGPVARYGSCSMTNECSGLWPLYLCALACYPASKWPREPMRMNTGRDCPGAALWVVYTVCSAWRKNALGVFAASLGTQEDVKRERYSSYCTCAMTK